MRTFGWDRDTSPYHAGEQELQDRLGRKEAQSQMARRIHMPYVPSEFSHLLSTLPVIFAGSVDARGNPWASALFGAPGFATTPSDKHFQLAGQRTHGDPFWDNAQVGAPVGFVGIDFSKRQRIRLNGVVENNDNVLDIGVVQAYGNCPRYIHKRNQTAVRSAPNQQSIEREVFSEITLEVAELISSADTFFVASYNDRDDPCDTGGTDVNHRGGNPGFVKVDGNSLTVPEFNGNFAFNTLGNFLINPKAGLLFINFDTGDLVQLTGRVTLMWDLEGDAKAFKGAERAWRFELDFGHILRGVSARSWQALEPSPFLIRTGSWEEEDT